MQQPVSLDGTSPYDPPVHHRLFAGSGEVTCDVALIGLPWDGGASLGAPVPATDRTPSGARLGWWLDRIRDDRVWHVEADTVIDLSGLRLTDYGDVPLSHDAGVTFDCARGVIAGALEAGCVPIVIGGDHSISIPGDPRAVRAQRAHRRRAARRPPRPGRRVAAAGQALAEQPDAARDRAPRRQPLPARPDRPAQLQLPDTASGAATAASTRSRPTPPSSRAPAASPRPPWRRRAPRAQPSISRSTSTAWTPAPLRESATSCPRAPGGLRLASRPPARAARRRVRHRGAEPDA